ncbi:MAG: hypothetical protein QOE58_2152 [Actinomycetota bacterium]|jgi:hypothetical protein|nr:hypothetical protein [Actinomycetota bacterium]
MSLMPSAAALATAGTEQLRELPMSPYAFGGIAFALLLLLLGVLWTFRNTASKYDTPVRVREETGESHQGTDPGAHH